MSSHARRAKFSVGQIVHHLRFGYRGVIIDADATFQGTEEWYEVVAKSRPPKHEPWYHVLVHDSEARTYVAERNLEPDSTGEPINHPSVALVFSELRDGVYVRSEKVN